MTMASDQPLRAALLAVCVAGALSACFQAGHAPDHAGFLADEPITFQGYALRSRQAVAVLVGPAETKLSHVLRARSEVEPSLTTEEGRPLYHWRVTSTLPGAAWFKGVDAEGCRQLTTYVAAGEPRSDRPPSGSPIGQALAAVYLHPSGLGDEQAECVREELAAGTAVQPLVKRCVGGVKPLRVTAINRHVGNVVIATAADLERLRCVDELDGTLSVVADAAAPFDVALPRLKRVTGDLQLTFTLRAWTGPEAEAPRRCEMRVFMNYAVSRRIDLPALSHVGGALSLETAPIGYTRTTGGEWIEVGLNALKSVGGDIAIRFDTMRWWLNGPLASSILPTTCS